MRWIQDPGHGGKDSGAYAYGQMEKSWTLEAALYVNYRLLELGISSGLTRSRDETLVPTKRTIAVKKSGAIYCISHHFNAGGGRGAEFIHSIYADGVFEEILRKEFEKVGMKTRRVFTRKTTNGKDYYFMHRETGRVRTTIIEYGFLDSSDYEMLKNKSFRFKLYEAVVIAICRHDQIAYKEISEMPTY
ncbi:N-acetylmuramoyl-L-alanine amidase [Fredinandcohnia humi]